MCDSVFVQVYEWFKRIRRNNQRRRRRSLSAAKALQWFSDTMRSQLNAEMYVI